MVTTDGPGRKEGRDTTAAWSCRVSFRYGRMSLTTKARQDGAALWPGWRERSVRSAGAASPDIGRTTSRHVELLRIYRLEREAAGAAIAQTQCAQPASSMLKTSIGATISPNAMRNATATTISASSARNCSALKRCE